MRIHFKPVVCLIVVALLLAACTVPAVQRPSVLGTEGGQAAGSSTSSAVSADSAATEVPEVAMPAASVADTTSSPASQIPLKDALDSLQPQDVFEDFYQITQIPRPSGYMEQIRDYLVEFGQGLGLETIVDEAGNVIIRKPAAAGYQNRSVDSSLEDIGQMIASDWELAGYSAQFSDYLAGWTPDPDSPVLSLMEATYVDLYGQEPVIIAEHVGLECGAIGAVYPDMDMVSIGPTIEDVHSPSEQLYIPSVDKTMTLLSEVLQRIPEQ